MKTKCSSFAIPKNRSTWRNRHDDEKDDQKEVLVRQYFPSQQQ
jgi:hypothetical protein